MTFHPFIRERTCSDRPSMKNRGPELTAEGRLSVCIKEMATMCRVRETHSTAGVENRRGEVMFGTGFHE